MDFQLSDDQQMILDSAARFAADAAGTGGVQGGFDRDRWRRMAGLGWIAAGIPPEFGGIGGAVENALIAQALGRNLLGGDFLAHAVLAPQLLVAAGDPVRRDALLPDLIEGKLVIAAAFSEPGSRGALDAIETSASGDRLSGAKSLVLGGDVANLLIVSARVDGDGEVQLFTVEPSARGVTVTPTLLVDGSSAANIAFAGALGEPLGRTADALPALQAMAAHGIATMAAETSGMIEGVIDLTADFLQGRSQFGTPLSQFQVLQHKLADMAIDLEMAKAYLLVALAAVEAGDAQAERRLSGVKVAIGEALRRVTGAAVQLHGGMGMSQEYPAGRYLQRMVVLDKILGSPGDHLGRVARQVD